MLKPLLAHGYSPMVVNIARLNMRLVLKVQVWCPGSLPVYPSLTLSTAPAWKSWMTAAARARVRRGSNTL